ncbi:hypothetical protein LTR65_008636 [Meristemomyces frigidus]
MQHTVKEELKTRLRSEGYTVPNRMLKGELVQMQQRVDCGHICYEKCTDAELQRFVIDRRLTPMTPNSHYAAKMALMREDARLRFGRFVNLPAELRNRIYQHYVSEFDDILTTPTQPPLARVCKQLHNEVLPVFYRSRKFHIVFERRPARGSGPTTFRMDSRTALFLTSLSKESIAEIRRLHVRVNYVRVEDTRSNEWRWIYKCNLKLDNSATGYRLKVKPSKKTYFRNQDAMAVELKRRFAKVYKVICARGSTKMLGLADIHTLRRVVEEVFE